MPTRRFYSTANLPYFVSGTCIRVLAGQEVSIHAASSPLGGKGMQVLGPQGSCGQHPAQSAAVVTLFFLVTRLVDTGSSPAIAVS